MDMGKAIKLNNKETGELLYPMTASDMVFNPSTKKSVKADLAEKIGDAPSDGKAYIRKNGTWVLAEGGIDPTLPILTVIIKSNQGVDTVIDSLHSVLRYGENEIYLANSTPINLPYGVNATITFVDVDDYLTPEPIIIEDVQGNLNYEVEYKTESVNVVVSSGDGSDVDEQVVSVFKQKSQSIPNGLYIRDIEGALWVPDIWTGLKEANSVVLVKDDIKVEINILPLFDSMNDISNSYNYPYYKTIDEAKLDKNGKTNSEYEYVIGGITNINYLTFKDGSIGYLPALGELLLIYDYKEELDESFIKVTGRSFNDINSTDGYNATNILSSTLCLPYVGASYSYCTYLNWNDGTSGTSNSWCIIRAFKDFDSTKEYLIYSKKDYIVGEGNINFKAEYGSQYMITASEKENYIINNIYLPIYAVASVPSQIYKIKYVNPVITTIRINQNVTDPSTMITKIVDKGAIELIRANSHRYTGSVNSEGVMELTQLDDNDGTKYVDGTTAILTTAGIDVWMKLPQFYWRCTKFADNIYDFSVVWGEKLDDTYKEWDGKDLIGVYEIYYNTTAGYSISGKSTVAGSRNGLRNLARNRGEGFGLVKWKHHCMMAMLFYTYYLNTNSQAVCGIGTDNDSKASGQTNSLGMEDTVAGGNGDSQSINFWGLENWWGNQYEWIDNFDMDENSDIVKITEDDGSIREFTIPYETGNNNVQFISKLLFGENIDLLPTEGGASENTGFCDSTSILNDTHAKYATRGGYGNKTNGGIAQISILRENSSSNGNSRISYRGEILIK